MKTIKIVTGTYGADNGKGGVVAIDRGHICEVDDQEAARLIALGVAEKVVATPQDANGVCEAGENTTDESGAQSGIVGHLDAEQFSTMTNAELKKLAEDMGLDTSKCRRKADFIDLITAEEVIAPETDDTEDDGELPPELSAEAPVV